MKAASQCRILLVEGKRADRPSFLAGLTKKGFFVESVSNGSAALTRLEKNLPELVLVDAASMRTSGKRICQAIRKDKKDLPIVLVLEKESETPDKGDADVVLVEPFTLQKLLNRIKLLLPVEEHGVLWVGPFKLNLEERWVQLNGKQARLTPRLLVLLRTMMEHPGEVIDREELFRIVWETEYTGDTRTLDVHISWLRQALEEDPRHPKFIKTVRGMGYRLDINQ